MDERQYYEEMKASAHFLEKRLPRPMDLAILTGTGLSDLFPQAECLLDISYEDIPHIPPPTVASHRGRLKVLRLGQRVVGLFQGRLHYYEGYDMKQITMPVRMLQFLNVRTAIFINAVGGMRGDLKVGDLVAIKDHIYTLPENPIRGLTMEEWGTRFPDPKLAYDEVLLRLANEVILDKKKVDPGTYVCVSGPYLETMAEIRFWRKNGGDVIGMSTIPEVLVACQAQIRTLVLSLVTNTFDNEDEVVKIEDVVAAGNRALPGITVFLQKLIDRMDQNLIE